MTPAACRSSVALLSLTLVGALALAGCGETASAPSAAAQASTSTSSTVAGSAAKTTTGSTAAAAGSHATPMQTKAKDAGSALPRAKDGHVDRSKAHLVLPPANSRPAPKLTASEAAELPVTDIYLASPAITQRAGVSANTIAREYTCHGANHSPPLRWHGIPSNTRELALFVMSVDPVAGKLFFDWAVGGLSPSIKELEAGKLPAGAVAGRNGYGNTSYSICPSGGKQESYVFVLYALPSSLSPKAGFDPMTLRKEAIHLSRHTGLLVGNYG
jgi:phosphatidylethanolamine-binding protein (PEBP) family uncharacterized protein